MKCCLFCDGQKEKPDQILTKQTPTDSIHKLVFLNKTHP